MGEKDGKEGHCPVCRTPYDKKLLEWQHMVSFQVNRKQKKPKGPEVKKQHLTDVRVLQRSLVYVIGIPLNLASEDLGLQPPHNLTIFMLAELSAMATSPITASPQLMNHPSLENPETHPKTLAAYFTTLLAWAVVCYWYQSSRYLCD
ncbi:hypothetical protein C1H46_001283 [Malus baccata]|uniref:Uncharacterized protein n=1 Tax=Malus baccata TaxID=106549 RepID=A0A540NQA9_MALBA|nr:hypothetical protein C1H46_001283 [Malus baccata]